MNYFMNVFLLVSLLFHKTTGFVTFSLKGRYVPSIEDRLLSENCLINSIKNNLPTANNLDISEWSDDKRSVSFTSRMMGKRMKHFKTQTKSERNGVLEFTEEDTIDGCVGISINTSWVIEKYKDITIECTVNVKGLLGKFLTPKVVQNVQESFREILDNKDYCV